MRYAEACEYLKKIQGENCKLSLANIQRVIARLPFAVGTVRYVQVAGTNGKGSTAHFIAAILGQRRLAGGPLHLAAPAGRARAHPGRRPDDLARRSRRRPSAPCAP